MVGSRCIRVAEGSNVPNVWLPRDGERSVLDRCSTKGVDRGWDFRTVSKSVVARFAASHVFSSLPRGVHLDAEMCKG